MEMALQERIDYAIRKGLPNIPRDVISVELLKGGYTAAYSYLLSCPQQSYVLRLQNLQTSREDLTRELLAAREAGKQEAAPKVIWAAADATAFIMEYIQGRCLQLAEAKTPETIEKIAQTMRKVHGLPRNPIRCPGMFERGELFYKSMQCKQQTNPETDQVRSLAAAIHAKVSKDTLFHATIHGDLNSRNIFISNKAAQFIDWSETNFDDFFYDLSYFGLMNNFTAKEVNQLLEAYFEAPPRDEHLERYQDFVDLSLFFIVSTWLDMDLDVTLDKYSPFFEWSWYVNKFADQHEAVDMQFFYDWGRAGIQKILKKNH